MHEVFTEWNAGRAGQLPDRDHPRHSRRQGSGNGKPLVDVILDTAGQKGTGKWTSQASLDLGVPAHDHRRSRLRRVRSRRSRKSAWPPARCFRAQTARIQGRQEGVRRSDPQGPVGLEDCSYAQGFSSCAQAVGGVQVESELRRRSRMIWRGGCIIRPLPRQDQGSVRPRPAACEPAARRLFQGRDQRTPGELAQGGRHGRRTGHPVPAFATALSYYDGYRTARLPANLLQAQRDYFGAHTYERTDRPRGEWYHTNWTGKGGNISASTYTV